MRADGVDNDHVVYDGTSYYYQYGDQKRFYPSPYQVPDPLPLLDSWVCWSEFYGGYKMDWMDKTWTGECTEWQGKAGDEGWKVP